MFSVDLRQSFFIGRAGPAPGWLPLLAAADPMFVSPEAPSSAKSSAPPARSHRLWTIVEPVLYYGLVASDAFARLSVRVRVALCAVMVLLVAGGIMLQAATLSTAPPNEDADLSSSFMTEPEEAGSEALDAREEKPILDRDGVLLTLRRSVRSPGTSAYAGDLLPAGTITIVYQEPGNVPHTLRNHGFASHGELIRQIIDTYTGVASPRRKGRVFVDTLTGLGQTRSTYIQTGSPTTNPDRFSTITYVAAKIPNGTMYQSYVDTGRGGFFVGFDAVFSGRMTMGPVAEGHAGEMREMFKILSAPAVDLPVLAGAIVQAMNGFPSAQAATSAGGSPPVVSMKSDLARAEGAASVQEKAVVASSQRVGAADEVLDRPKRPETPSSPNRALERSERANAPALATSAAESGFSDIGLLLPPVGEFVPRGEPRVDEPDGGQSPTAVSAATADSPETMRAPQDASTADASGVSGWWVVVALFGGMAGGGAAGYGYWAREIEAQARQMAQLRAEHRQEHATRKVQSIRGMISDAPADITAPEFELGDDFWESSTVTTGSMINGEPSASDDTKDSTQDNTRGDTAWLDDLPF